MDHRIRSAAKPGKWVEYYAARFRCSATYASTGRDCSAEYRSAKFDHSSVQGLLRRNVSLESDSPLQATSAHAIQSVEIIPSAMKGWDRHADCETEPPPDVGTMHQPGHALGNCGSFSFRVAGRLATG